MLDSFRLKIAMSPQFSHTSSLTKFIIVVEFLLVAYLLYSLTKNVYNTYQVDKYIAAFEEENAAIESENVKKNKDYLYFTSEEYIDKIAKQNLGLVNPGEEVIVIAPDAFTPGSAQADESSGDDVAKYAGMSNPGKWWDFFFGS